MDSKHDVVIIGGGIGGSGLAAVLARQGLDVAVLERTTTFPDRVRGEMWTPWGVHITSNLGLLAPLLGAGAMFSTRWTFYDAELPTDFAEAIAVDLSKIVPGVPGVLNIGHPAASQALHDFAGEAGASMHRGVTDVELVTAVGGSTVRCHQDGDVHELRASLVVGADGRTSTVRRHCGIELHSAPVRQYMTGLLVEGDRPLSRHVDSYGTGVDVNWYSFPQGPRTSRVYLAHLDVHRYAGGDGTARFLTDLRQCAGPDVQALAGGRAVSPIATHPSVDTWTDVPYADGAVLVGDAAGYNDPIIGQGLSLTMADIRDVARVIVDGGRTPTDFAAYAVARADRHTKQRIAAQTMAELFCSFARADAERRMRALPLMESDAMALAATVFAGPEALPPGAAPVQAAGAAMLAA